MEHTDRDRIPPESEEHEHCLKTTINAIHDIVHVVDGELRIVFYNHAFGERLKSLGITVEPMGIKLPDLVPGLPVEVFDEYGTVFRTARSLKSEEEFYLGESLWSETTKFPILSQDGRVHRVITVIREITERKNTEARLRESEAKYRTLVETVPYGILVSDLEGRIIYNNHALEAMFGIPRGAAIGEFLWDMAFNQSFREQLQSDYERIIRDHPEPATFFRDSTRIDGETFHCQFDWNYIYAPDGVTVHSIISIITDISEIKRLEKIRADAEMQSLQAQKIEAIAQLTGGIAHDFNNLLHVITGYTDLSLEEIERHNPIYDSLQQIAIAGDRASTLVSQLLAFGRRQIMRFEYIDLNSVVTALIERLKQAFGISIGFEWSPSPDIPMIKADSNAIEQAITNLCINSREAMPDGGTLTLATGTMNRAGVPEGGPTTFVRLNVTDTGVGIERSIRHRIFEPFFTTKGKPESTGLGLATTHGIVKQHNGFIDFESEAGAGTTFSIFLPAAI